MQGTAAFTNVTITGNRVNTTNVSLSDSSANGGGALINSLQTFSYTNGTIVNNAASATFADHAHGGGMSFEYSVNSPTATLTDLSITGNTARLTNAGGVTNANNYARGGGVFVYKSDATDRAGFTAEGVSFSNNQAIVDGTTAAAHTATASGGAIDFFGNISGTFTDVSFTNNSAHARAAGANALGGAFAHDSGAGDARFERATFERNTVTATGAAMGGAIYHQNGTLEIIDTAIRDNSVTGATAFGGGIYIDAPFGASMVRLSATAGNTTVISVNTANGAADGIYFGQYTGNTAQNSTLMVEGAGRTMLLDPVTVNVDGNFTMNTTSSDFHWDQANVWRADNATLALNNSTTHLGSNFSLDTSQSATANVMFGSSTIRFDAARDRDNAMFNFANSASYNGSSILGVDTERQLVNLSGAYLVADADITSYLTRDTATISDIYAQGGSTYADVDAVSPYADSLAAAGRNAQNAAAALNQLVSDRQAISDADFIRISRNFSSATPQLAVDQAGVAVEGSTRFAEEALRIGLRKPFFESRYNYGASPYRRDSSPYRRRYAGLSADQALASMVGSYHCGFRVWAGYVGNFRTMDRHRGYNGFRARQNGVLIGLNYDWGETASVGIYGGYSRARTNARGANSRVTANAGHWGIGGRLSPIPILRDLNLYLDAGLSYFDNDTWRDMSGARASGSFDQTTVTAGLAVEYDFRIGCLTLTPGLKTRYTHLWQDGLNESGLTAVRTNKLRADNFHTALGLEAAYDFTLGPVVLTPSARAAWRHEFGDRRYRYNAHYAGVANPIGFTVGSARVDRDSLDIGAAIRAGISLGRTQLGVNLAYNANISNNATTHGIYAGVELGF